MTRGTVRQPPGPRRACQTRSQGLSQAALNRAQTALNLIFSGNHHGYRSSIRFNVLATLRVGNPPGIGFMTSSSLGIGGNGHVLYDVTSAPEQADSKITVTAGNLSQKYLIG